VVSKHLIHAIIAQHRLRRANSIHSIDHWARVTAIGRRLARVTGARLDVVELFAVFHDSGRWNDGGDHDHGRRGAEIARQMRGVHFELDDEGMELLVWACRDHTLGKVEGDITVQTCWDSDRLDLGRAAIKPAAHRLCTSAARNPDMMAWAYERSIHYFKPEDIYAEWGIDPAGRPTADE